MNSAIAIFNFDELFFLVPIAFDLIILTAIIDVLRLGWLGLVVPTVMLLLLGLTYPSDAAFFFGMWLWCPLVFVLKVITPLLLAYAKYRLRLWLGLPVIPDKRLGI